MEFIPSKLPSNRELLHDIQFIANEISVKGEHYEEDVIKSSGIISLQDKESEEHEYLKLVLYCKSHGADVDQQLDMHTKRIEGPALVGLLNLTKNDESCLRDMLSNNNGTKDTIKSIRRWCMERAHSIVAISKLFFEYVMGLVTETRIENQNRDLFELVLKALYVINDILYNHKTAIVRGVYTMILSRSDPVDVATSLMIYLPTMLRRAMDLAESQTKKDKINRLIELWRSKGFFNQSQIVQLQNAVSTSELPVSPVCAEFVPPQFLILPPTDNTHSTTVNNAASMPPPPPPPPPPAVPREKESASKSGFQPITLSIAPPQPPRPPAFSMNINTSQAIPTLPPPPPPPRPPQTNPILPPPMPPIPPFTFPQQPPAPMVITPAPMNTIPPYFPASNPLDPMTMSVGHLVNLAKAQLKTGYNKYSALDISYVRYLVNIGGHVEPGRLEAKTSDFYSKLSEITNR